MRDQEISLPTRTHEFFRKDDMAIVMKQEE